MADRTVYGNDFSENGWRMVDQDSCVWVTVPGTSVHLQIREGQPVVILGAFAADFNAYVEPLRDADSACWTPTNAVASSNHLSGTAMDLNWQSHPFQVSYAGFDAAKIATMRQMLEFYEELVWWGQDWQSPKDAMHLQMNGDTYGSDNVEKVNDFIRRKVRADGFSTFRRDDAVTSPPAPSQPALSREDGYSLKIIAEGRHRGITPRGIQIALATALVESNIKVYANERVPASMDIPHDAVGSDAYSVGIFQQQVRDTGNGWWWGDAATCMDPTTSAGLFYDRLSRLDYNGSNSPGSYAQDVQDSAYPDRYDERFDDAVAIYNRLANATPDAGDDFMAALSDSEQREVLDLLRWIAAPDTGELRKKFKSRSPLRHTDEGYVETLAGFILNVDAHEHVDIVKLQAAYNDPDSLALLREVAGNTEAGREHDAQLAQAILADLGSATKPAKVQYTMEAQSAPAPAVVFRDNPAPTSTGQLIGNAYDAAKALLASPDMDDTEKSAAAALISVLQTKTGVTA